MLQSDQAAMMPNANPAPRSEEPAGLGWPSSLAALGLVLGLILILYRETAVGMASIWYRSETFTHGFVVVPIVLWLVWRRRQELAYMTPRPAPWMLAVVAALALMWLLGDLVVVNVVTQLALVAMLVAAVPLLLGLSVARAITFPLAFMFFAVPIGEFMMPQLMEWTANFTILALRASGIPVYREGLNFVIPSGSWSVVEACSGVRYLIASLTVGTLYAYLNYQTTKKRILFVLVSILVPVVANWLRAYMIVILGHLSGNTLAVGVDHLIYGWVFFGVVILLMFMVGARWSDPDEVRDAPPTTRSIEPVATSLASPVRVTVLAALILVMPVLAQHAFNSNTDRGDLQLAKLDLPADGWQIADAAGINFKPRFENPSAERTANLSASGKTVGLYLAYYREQGHDRKLVSSTNVLVASTDSKWRRLRQTAQVQRWGERERTVRGTELNSLPGAGLDQPDRILAWQMYWIDGTLTSNDHIAKALGAIYQLIGRKDDSAVIVVYTEQDRTDDAQATLAAFLRANYGAIDAALRKTRNTP